MKASRTDTCVTKNRYFRLKSSIIESTPTKSNQTENQTLLINIVSLQTTINGKILNKFEKIFHRNQEIATLILVLSRQKALKKRKYS